MENVCVHPAGEDVPGNIWLLFIPVMLFVLMAILCCRYWTWSVAVHFLAASVSGTSPKSWLNIFSCFLFSVTRHSIKEKVCPPVPTPVLTDKWPTTLVGFGNGA